MTFSALFFNAFGPSIVVRFEIALGGPALGAVPVIRKVFKGGARLYAPLRVAILGVVNVTADAALIPPHEQAP
jgi:hypothetical protein